MQSTKNQDCFKSLYTTRRFKITVSGVCGMKKEFTIVKIESTLFLEWVIMYLKWSLEVATLTYANIVAQ